MYLSRLLLNPRHSQVRRDLAEPYELHRTVMRAFPSKDQGGPGRVLFRLEPYRSDQPSLLLLQSTVQPDWSFLNELGEYTLSMDTKTFQLDLQPDQPLRFRLRANVTVRRNGQRHGLFQEVDQRDWLRRQGNQHGFDPIDIHIGRRGRQVTRRVRKGQPPRVHHAVEFDGRLRVTDPDRLTLAVCNGVGPAKAFGFGLLSLARAGTV